MTGHQWKQDVLHLCLMDAILVPMLRKISLFWLLLMVALPGLAAEPLSKDRMAQVAAWLPENPSGPGQPINNRPYWNGKAAHPVWGGLIARAEKLLATPLPAQPDELYLEFSRNGNRTRWQNVASQRRGRLPVLVLAECLENKGRFVPAIETLITALCAEKTWLMPAHDAKLDNFNGKTIDIDLASSALGWNLSLVGYLVGEKLGSASRQMVRDNVQRRILAPYKAMFRGERAMNWWMTTTNNWNSVCLAGVTGAALIEIPSREERAEYVVAAENYSKHFLEGFTPDGYCSEGLGYWNYGFGHYALLSEDVRRATGGKLDLLALPAAKMPARFGTRIQIINGISPAFADCGVFATPLEPLMVLLNAHLNLSNGFDVLNPGPTFGSLFEALIYDGAKGTPANRATTPPRDFFDSAGILISRPAMVGGIGVALKGGHNNEHHNHNDLGSYVVVSGERPVLLDPGNETYTARTFSNKRYDSKLLNSYGHPVPVVAGQLQKEGAQSRAKVLKSEFTEARDTLQLDIASAYPVPELKNLTRTFMYSRDGKGTLSVSDNVAFTAPKSFGTAILTLGSWKQQPDGSLLVFDVDEALRVEIDSGGRAYSIEAEEIREDAPVVPTRLGINLKEPVTEATVTLKITSFALPETGNALLRNGNFEFGSWGWELPTNGMGAVSNERAASGTASLKISDTSKEGGSNVSTARRPLEGGKRYMLRGKVWHANGSGLGLYMKFYGADRQMLNPSDNGNIAPVGTTPTKIGQWENFSFPFQTPPGTTTAQLWIHSFNGALSELFLDDLEIVPAP